MIIKASADERRQQFELVAWGAWHTAALGRSKKMPTLKAMIGHKEAPKDLARRLSATIKDVVASKKKA